MVGQIVTLVILSSLHLTKNNQDKVVVVVAQRFYDKDENSYYFVYEAKNIELSKQKLKDFEQKWREEFFEDLNNLSKDEKQILKDYFQDEILDEYREIKF